MACDNDLDIDTCCCVLAVFGYPADECEELMTGEGPNPLAEPDASNLVKLTDLMLDSPFGMIVDWRGDPVGGFIEPLCKIAAGCGVAIEAEYDEDDLDAVTLIVQAGGKTHRVVGRTGPAEVALPALAELGRGVEQASGGRVVTRVAAIYQPSDTWGYVALSPEQWRTVQEAVGAGFGRLFVE
jgi:hypothetical protein